nr:MAG TPA: hypothetical protein [Caudoviricetes sp.]
MARLPMCVIIHTNFYFVNFYVYLCVKRPSEIQAA